VSTVVEPRTVGRADADARALIRRVLGRWRRAVLARALLLAPALGLLAALGLVAADLLWPLSATARETLRWLPPLLAAGVLGRAAWRVARPPDDRRLALLAEERVPALGNRLATLLDLARSDVDAEADGVVLRAFHADAAARVRQVDPRQVVPLRVRRPAALLAVAAAIALGFALAFSGPAREAWERWRRPVDAYPTAWEEARAEVVPSVPEPPVPGFDELRWRVRPPAYTGLPERELRGAEGLTLLPGTRVSLRSRFPERWSGVRASLVGGGLLPVRRGGGEWSVAWTQSDAKGVALEAVAAGAVVDRRVVPITPRADQPPDIALREPAADVVLASASGVIPVRASASDDFGVGDFRLTWIRSRGSGESYSFEEGEWQWSRVARNGSTVTGEYALDLGAMGLRPGDMIHLRAVARDRNDVGGPGESVSQTRVIRIARPEEMDQVTTVVGIPPEVEKNPVLSQRMLILMTERLRDRAPRMARDAVLSEGQDIGAQQGRLRDRVGEQIFTRSTGGMQLPGAEVGFQDAGGAPHGHEGEEHAGEEEARTPEQVLEEASEATGRGTLDEVAHRHDEAPVIGVDRRLLTIYNAMYAAERELGQGAAAAALPHQYEALRLIKQAQEGERRYVRGTVRVDPVDVAAARGTGVLDEAAPQGRSAGPAAPSPLPLLADVDRAAAGLRARPPREAALALSALAERALAAPGTDPRAAALLARAADAAGRGRGDEARRLLAQARALLDAGGGGRAAGAPLPSTADPAAAEYFRRLGAGGRP
jgi:hypothetical protein